MYLRWRTNTEPPQAWLPQLCHEGLAATRASPQGHGWEGAALGCAGPELCSQTPGEGGYAWGPVPPGAFLEKVNPI